MKILHADETTYRILEHTERQKCYIWLYATSFYEAPIYIYEYQKTRAEEHPKLFLKNYNGYLVCDDLKSYDNIENVKTCRCWFHAKKKYADLIKTLTEEQKEKSVAVVIHNRLSEIFHEDAKIIQNSTKLEEIEKQRNKTVS